MKIINSEGRKLPRNYQYQRLSPKPSKAGAGLKNNGKIFLQYSTNPYLLFLISDRNSRISQ